MPNPSSPFQDLTPLGGQLEGMRPIPRMEDGLPAVPDATEDTNPTCTLAVLGGQDDDTGVTPLPYLGNLPMHTEDTNPTCYPGDFAGLGRAEPTDELPLGGAARTWVPDEDLADVAPTATARFDVAGSWRHVLTPELVRIFTMSMVVSWIALGLFAMAWNALAPPGALP